MNKKLQIRWIHDVRGYSYKIYDVMENEYGVWRSVKETYFSKEEALRFNIDIEIEDLTE